MNYDIFSCYVTLGCAWIGCQDDLTVHKKVCDYKPTMELCQEIKEKNNIITHLSKKLDAATLSIAELMEENRLLKMKLYECNRKFRIYDAFLSGGDNTLKNDADDSSMKDDLDFKNNYPKDKNEISHLRDIICYSNDYDDEDRIGIYINDYNYDNDVDSEINRVASTATEFDDMRNLMKLRNLRSFKDSQQGAINKVSMNNRVYLTTAAPVRDDDLIDDKRCTRK